MALERGLSALLNTVGVTPFAPLASYADRQIAVSVSAETHVIPENGDYVACLDYIPKVNTDAWNTWVDIATAEAIGFTVTVDNAARTLTDSFPPIAGTVFVGISTVALSTRLCFNDADVGKTARITYQGLWSLADVPILEQHGAAIQRLETAPWLKPWCRSQYAGGAWDGSQADGKTLYLWPSPWPLTGRNGAVAAFPGLLLDFAAGGNCEVAGFTNDGYWKRIAILLDYDGADWIVATVESAEAATVEALVTPATDPTWILIGYVDVQQDSALNTAGDLLPIAQAQVTAHLVIPATGEVKSRDFVYFGDLIAGEAIDAAFAFPANGVLLGVLVTMEDAGSSGLTTIDLLYHEAGDTTGATVFADPGDKPQIAGSGTAADRYFISQAFLAAGPGDDPNAGFLAVASGQVYRFVLEDVATGAKNIRLTLTYRLFR